MAPEVNSRSRYRFISLRPARFWMRHFLLSPPRIFLFPSFTTSHFPIARELVVILQSLHTDMSFVRVASRRLPLAKRVVSAVESPLQRRCLSATSRAQNAVITPDPAADSVSVAFVNERAPYLVPTYVRPNPIMVKGQGCYLWDMENRRYLDLTAGIAVNSLGHCDPEIAKIIAEQVRIEK